MFIHTPETNEALNNSTWFKKLIALKKNFLFNFEIIENSNFIIALTNASIQLLLTNYNNLF